MLGVLEKVIELALEALKARGDAQLLAEVQAEMVTLRREVNELKDYRERREVEDEALAAAAREGAG